MSEVNSYKLEMFGMEFSLTTKDGDVDGLKRVAEYYKRVVNQILNKNPNLPHINVAVLAGLTLTDELYNLAKSKNIRIDPDYKKADDLLNQAIKELEFSLNI